MKSFYLVVRKYPLQQKMVSALHMQSPQQSPFIRCCLLRSSRKKEEKIVRNEIYSMMMMMAA